MAEFVVRHYGLRSLWVETDRSAQFGVVDEVAKVRGRKRRRPEPPHHHANKSIVAFMDDLKAGGRQDFDSGFAGDIVRSSAFCQSNFGALRHQVFTDRRVFHFLCKRSHRAKTSQQEKHHEIEISHVDLDPLCAISKLQGGRRSYAATAFPPCLASRICAITLRMAALEPGLFFSRHASRRLQ